MANQELDAKTTSEQDCGSSIVGKGCSLVAVVFLVSFFWVSNLRDSPKDYSSDTLQILRDRIKGHEKEIEEIGSAASALDADRYWPYDRDRTVLAMFLFKEQKGRWPHSWDELRESDHLEDGTCIHGNWVLSVSDDGWEIAIEGYRMISFYEGSNDH